MGIDVGTQLVQAYLQANGYFTVADYPLLEVAKSQQLRSVTDLDMLAVRFAGQFATKQKEKQTKVIGPMVLSPDTALACPQQGTDMIVAEVKQGRARVNPASRNPKVLGAALTRFGCCDPADAERVVSELLQQGHTKLMHGHKIRMVLFASTGESAPAGWHLVHLEQVFIFLDKLLHQHQFRWRATDFHDPALAWLALLQKSKLSLQTHSG